MTAHCGQSCGSGAAQRGLQAHSVPAIISVLILDGPHRMLSVLLSKGGCVHAQHQGSALQHVLLLYAK